MSSFSSTLGSFFERNSTNLFLHIGCTWAQNTLMVCSILVELRDQNLHLQSQSWEYQPQLRGHLSPRFFEDHTENKVYASDESRELCHAFATAPFFSKGSWKTIQNISKGLSKMNFFSLKASKPQKKFQGCIRLRWSASGAWRSCLWRAAGAGTYHFSLTFATKFAVFNCSIKTQRSRSAKRKIRENPRQTKASLSCKSISKCWNRLSLEGPCE